MIELSERRIRRFWAMVEKGDGCWLWKGALEANGYATTQVGSGAAREHWLCHRLAFRIANGFPPPPGHRLVVMHSCDVRHCVNPAHLALGTPRQNNQDALRKGRNKPPQFSHPGEANGRAVLTEQQVLEIRASREHYQTLAKRYGVSPGTIYYARKGGWKSVSASAPQGVELGG